ncbi:acyltransferase 3 [Caballeronia catudaia]|uniref:Acyltransferase 3 n=1 Tax=Caballeronia catudaia TaxID=1777136 RepID=A0A158B842_9BURK|nr:acyltransferase [Caballeronia catudaia]SAK65926.1 acyltransferase 3 [Caballeronia catudaia]
MTSFPSTKNNEFHFCNIQALRGLAVMLVLAFHVYAIETKYFSGHIIPDALGVIGTSGVDLFFVISGFVIVSISRDGCGNPASALEFMKHRVLRIYPLYWIYSLIVLSIMLISPRLVNASSGHRADILASLTLFPSVTLPLLLQGWTLTYEMFFYLVFAALLAFSSRRFLGALLAVWAVVTFALACWVRSEAMSHPALDVVSSPLVLEFIAGCASAMIWQRISRRASMPVFAVTVASIVVVALMIEGSSLDAIIQWRAAYFGVPSFLVVLSAILAERRFGFIAPASMQVLGDMSYSLYLSHILVISAVGRMWSWAFPAGPFFWGTLGAVAAAIALGWVSFRFVETPLLLASKRVFDKRPSMLKST